MIFLGAGASKPYGIPTLQEFSEDAISILTQSGHEDLIKEIEQSLSEFNIQLDFEALYSILERLSDPLKAVQLSDPFTAFILKSKNNLPPKSDFSKVLNELRKIIYEKCTITSKNFPMVTKNMSKLLKVTEKNTSVENVLGTQLRIEGKNIGQVIVTTNYDMAIEQYFDSKNISINDGYRESFPVKIFQPKLLLDPHSFGNKTVIKLHGSIWQFLKNGNMIKTRVDPNSSVLPYNVEVDQEMMIYPTRQKDLLNYQYFPFYQCFKNISWTKLLVIGYSFRDELINAAIIENMISRESQLIIINPDCDKAIQNLYDNVSDSITWKIPEYRLYKYDGYFGDDDVFEYLKSIERVSWNQDPK